MRLTDNPGFAKLASHLTELDQLHLPNLLQDKQRQAALSIAMDDLHIDLSRHKITEHTLDIFADMAQQADLAAQFEKLFSGEIMIPQKRVLCCIWQHAQAKRFQVMRA